MLDTLSYLLKAKTLSLIHHMHLNLGIKETCKYTLFRKTLMTHPSKTLSCLFAFSTHLVHSNFAPSLGFEEILSISSGGVELIVYWLILLNYENQCFLRDL